MKGKDALQAGRFVVVYFGLGVAISILAAWSIAGSSRLGDISARGYVLCDENRFLFYSNTETSGGSRIVVAPSFWITFLHVPSDRSVVSTGVAFHPGYPYADGPYYQQPDLLTDPTSIRAIDCSDIAARWSRSQTIVNTRIDAESDFTEDEEQRIGPSEFYDELLHYAHGNSKNDKATLVERFVVTSNDANIGAVIEDRFGWPFLCLSVTYGVDRLRGAWDVSPSFSGLLLSRRETGTNVESDPNNLRALPLRPLVGGLFLNSIIFGVGLAFLYRGVLWGIRIRRLRGGRCPRCSYDLQRKQIYGCPECGWNRPENEGQNGRESSASE